MSILISCINNRNENNSIDTGVEYPTTNIFTEDSASVKGTEADSTNTISNEPQQPQLSFATAEDALAYMNESKDASKYAEGIIPHMVTEELSYATKLLNNQYNRFLIIDKELMRVGLFDKYGREILSYGIACARNFGTKHRKADSRTPEGFFSVEGIYNSTDWLFTNDNGYTSPAKGQFGPRFIRIKNPVSSQIGLHGTAAPGSIGRRCSHGCIRVKNENILELVKYVEPGMPVIITPSMRDQQVNVKEGVHVAMVTMDPFGKYSAPEISKPKKETAKKLANPAEKESETSVVIESNQEENVTPTEEQSKHSNETETEITVSEEAGTE